MHRSQQYGKFNSLTLDEGHMRLIDAANESIANETFMGAQQLFCINTPQHVSSLIPKPKIITTDNRTNGCLHTKAIQYTNIRW